MLISGGNLILLYDGVCGLCNRLVHFVIRRDEKDVFRFASLQSDLAEGILARHNVQSQFLQTVYLVVDSGLASERLLSRSDAIICLLRQLGGINKLAASAFRFLPASLRDFLYDLVSRHRYRIFGKYDNCPLPDPRIRSKFLDC